MAEQEYSQQKSVSRSGGGDKSKLQSTGWFHDFFCFFKMESHGRAKPQNRARYNMHKQPSQRICFLFLCSLMSHRNHFDEKVEAIHTADISRMLYLVSVKLELKYTLIFAWEKRQNSLYVRSHTYLLWVHNLKDKNELKVMFLFKANRIQILEISVYKTLPHQFYIIMCFSTLYNLLYYGDFSVESLRKL